MDAGSPTTAGWRRRLVGVSLAVAALAGLSLAALAGGLGGQDAARQSIVITAGKTTTVSGAEDLVAGLTKVTIRPAGRAPANVFVVRLLPGKTLADLRAAARRTDAVPEGTVVVLTGGFVEPGGRFVSTVNLPPGEYVAAQSGDRPGIVAPATFTVGRGAAGGTPPRAGATVLMYDYGFRAPVTIRGRGTLAVKNIGQNYHFIAGIRLNPGVDAAEVREQLISDTLPAGPPPGEFVQILGVVAPATTNYLETDLEPGTYLLACFFADRHSAGHDHSEFGMVRKVVVR